MKISYLAAVCIVSAAVTVSACATRKSFKSVERVTDSGDLIVRARLDPSVPTYANEAVIKSHICTGLGQLKSFEAVDGGFKATCGAPIIARKDIDFPNYPQIGYTYLSFSDPAPLVLFKGHGFQVEYYESENKSWLWYPENERSLLSEWKFDGNSVCFKSDENTYNPVTNTQGGSFACQDLELSRKLTVSRLDGDPFNLASGTVPTKRDKCVAPSEFEFDRERFACTSQE